MTFNRLAILLLLGTVAGTAMADVPPARWKAAAAKVKITPEEPMWMSGYSSRNRPAEGTLHDLWAKALAIQDPQGNGAVLITADLIGISKELADSVCGQLTRRLGLSRQAIMISTSHTHTGPFLEKNLSAMVELSPGEEAKVKSYTLALEGKIVQLAVEAWSKMEPANLSWNTGHATFAVNRRENRAADVPRLRAAGQLKGPVDHDVPVLRVQAADGTTKAVVFGYACHCTVLSFYKWSGDYAGFAQMELEKTNPSAVALFFAGCGADQNPLPRRSVELAAKYGKELAASTDRVLSNQMHPVSGSLAARFRLVELPYERVPTSDEIKGRLEQGNKYERLRARLLLDQIRQFGQLRRSYPYPVQVWQLGPELTWVALGGEVVVDYSLRLKRELGPGHTWVAGYSNDVMAYIPSLRVLKEGGYEGGGSMVYYGLPSRWAPSVEQKIVEQVRRLAAEARQQVRDNEPVQLQTVYSGPQAGERLTELNVVGVYGELRDKPMELMAEADGRPLLLVFVHSASRPSAALVRTLLNYAEMRAHGGLYAALVWLADDRPDAQRYLGRATSWWRVGVPVGISVDGAEGPGAYGLNRRVSLTILVGRGSAVTANFALVQPSLTDAPRILAALNEQIGGRVPCAQELELLRMSTQLPAKLARRGQAPRDPKLRSWLCRLLAQPDEAPKVAALVERYVAGQPARRKQLAGAARALIRQRLGSGPAAEQLRGWAK